LQHMARRANSPKCPRKAVQQSRTPRALEKFLGVISSSITIAFLQQHTF
jgi:hypothetical protein